MLNDFYHMLDPVAISAGPITIYWYGLAYVVGALLTAVVMYRTQRRWGFNITIDDLTSVVVGVVFGLIIGARLFYVVFYGDGYYWAHPLEIFATNEGGMSFHGGLVGGIIGGVFSATEGSAIAVVYALILAFCYRSINLKSLWKIIVDSAKMSGMVVFLVGVSNILGWVMAFLQIPDAVAAALLSLTSNKYIILLIMNVILLVSGTFMDVTPAILIFTPLFLPICQSFGMSTIQFGLILVYNLCIGNITPPVGNALFVGIKVGRTSLSKVMPYMLMYYVAIIGGLLLVTFIPAVSTALPQAMGLM